MNKFGQKIRDCGHPRISSARPGAAMMASIRNWAVPAVMAATLILSGCQTLNPDSAEGESNSLLKTLAVAFVGGAAIWGSTDSGSSDDSPLLPPRAEDPCVVSLPPPRETQTGRATFTINSNKGAPAGGFQVSFSIRGGGFNIDDTDADQLAAIAAIVGSQANNHVNCEGSICTVTIPEGETSATFTLIPVGEVTSDDSRWTVSLVPAGINDPFEIENGNRGAPPIEVANTPTGISGGFSEPQTVDEDLRQVSVQTPVLNRVAGPLGFDIEFTPPENFRPVANPQVSCDPDDPTACRVTIPQNMLSLPIIFEPVPMVVREPTSSDTFTGMLTFGDPNPTTGEIIVTTPTLDAPAPSGGRDFVFTLEDNFRIVAGQSGVSCTNNVCTVTIDELQISRTVRIVPTPISQTDLDMDMVMVGFLPDTQDFAVLPVFVGFDTPEPTVDPDNGEVTFTVRSNVAAPAGGLTVSISIEGDAFTAMLPANCQGEVCTVVIPAGRDRVAFVLVPQGTATTNWEVAIVPDTTNNYGINVNSQTPVDVATTPPPAFVVGFDTPEPTVDTDTGNVTFTFVSDTAAPVGGFAVSITITGSDFMAMLPDGTVLNCPLDVCTVTILEGSDTVALILVPQGTATTNWEVAIVPDTTNNYGINVNSQTPVDVATTPPPAFVVGFSTPEPTVDMDTGNVTFTFVSDTAAPVGGFAVSITITGSDFMAMLPDGTVLNCPLDVCTVTILEGSDTVALILVPQGTATTNWEVAIVPDTTNNYGINVNSQTPVDVATTPPPAFVVGFSTPEPTVDMDTGNVTFTFVSDTAAPVGGFAVSITITGSDFMAMLPDGTVLNCPLDVCTVTILEGSDTVALILVPQGTATTNWEVAIVPDTTNNYGINVNSQTPVDVATTPPPAFVVGFSTPEPTVDMDTGNVTFTFVSDTAAPVGGFAVSITITGSDFMAMLPDGTVLNCPLDVCTVTILEGSDTVALILVPQGTATTNWEVAIVPDTTNNYGINVNSQTPVDVATTPPPAFVVGFSTPEPTVDMDTGNVTFTFVSDTAAPVGGFAVSITITGSDFMAMLPDGTVLNCPLDVCTVTILEGSDTVALILVPQGTATTNWEVAIVPDTTNNYGINVNSQTPVDVATILPAVGFSTPQPTVEQNTGNVTFTVESNVDAPTGGFDVSFRIEGEGFTAMLPDGSVLVCPQNVCTVRIPVGTRTAAFILVPLGPAEGGSSDLDLIRWTVTIVDDSSNNYAIVDDSPTAVIAGEITLIAEGEADFTLDRNAPVRFGEVTALFRPQALPGDLDILEIPHASRITAESNADSFASGYGYFADDGGFLPFDTSIVDLGFGPNLTGNFVAEMHMGLTGETTWRLRRITLPAPSGGYQIGIRVGGVAEADFDATLLDGTPVDCPNSVCELTIPAGETRPPNLVLTPTGTGFDPLSFGPENWMLEVAPIPRGNPLSPDPLSNNRANSDEAIFYARRGDKLVARFHTTGTFMTTAIVEAIQPFTSFLDDEGNTIPFNPDTDLPPPFDREDFDPEPFNFLPGTDVNADCSNLVSGTPPRRACNIELNAHEIRQTQLQTAYSNFGTTYLTFVRQVCRNVGGAGCAALSFNINSLPFLIVDGRGVGFRATALNPRPENARSVGEVVDINRPVAIALPITSTLVAADDDVQELVYSYFQDLDGDGMIDLLPPDGSGFQFEVFETITVGSLDFALYQSGEIPNALPPTDDFSVSQIDPNAELLGRSNIRTFLYENEFSAIGAWLIPPTAEEINADADAPYYAAAAHWFGFQTPVDRIPTAGQAVYGGIATGDFRQVTFDNAGAFAGKRSFYVFGSAQFDADFTTSEMDGEFELDAYHPEDVYGDPTFEFAEPVDTLVVNWEGQILPDGRGFANNSFPAFEPLFDRNGNPVLNDAGDDQLAREILAPAATLFQPRRVEESDADRMDPFSPAFGREPVFDNLVQVGDDSGIPGAPPGPSPIGDGALFSVFGKFFGPDAEEVAGELRVFNSRSFFVPEHTDTGGNVIPEIDESVTSVLEVHFTATGDDAPDGRFDLPDIPLPNPDSP